MAIQLKKIAESPTTYAAFKALKEEWQALFGNQNAVFANDGTTKVPEDAKNKIATIKVFDKDDKPIGYSKTYNDAKTVQAQEETWYKVTLDKADKTTLEEDLKTVKFCFWVQNPKGETLVIDSPKKAIMITVKGNASSSDITTDILEPKNTETLTTNLAKAYHYAKIEYTKEEAILKIKWSKWLDRHFVRVEAYQKQINIKVDGGNTTASRYVKAKPQIIKGYWANDNKDTITNKIVGYKDTVYMCLKTLGMQNKNLELELWEDDYGYGDEQIEIENTAFEITDRYTYKKLELPEKSDDDYQKQRGGAEGNQLELYYKLPKEKETQGYKDGYAKSLKLITHEKLTEAYFAKEEKREQIQDSTLPEAEQTPATHAVKPKQTITDVATEHGLNAQELATLNKVTLTETLTYGTSVQLKTEIQIAADKKAKEDRAKKQEKAKTEPSYQRIESASLGSEVWLVVESANLQGKTASVQIFDNEELLEDSDNTAITVLKNDAEVTKLENLKFDDEGIAKVKIKLRKKSDEDYKKQKEKFKDDKIAKLFLKITCKGEDDTHKIEFLDGEEFEVKKSDTIFIYYTGHITKVEGLLEKEKISYTYIDKNNKKHDLGSFDIVKAQKWKKGSSTANSSWKKVKIGAKTRYYEYGNGKTPLIKTRLPISYNKDGIEIYLADNTTRDYINPEAYACLLGALAENSYKDVNFNGSVAKDGTGAPSVTHYNGMAIDFRYLRTDKTGNGLEINNSPNSLDVKRQEKLIDAFVKFGWSSFYSFNITLNKKKFILKNSTHLAGHHNHLHLVRSSFKPNYK